MHFTKLFRAILCLVPLFLMGGCSKDDNTENTVAPDPRAVEIRTASKLKQFTTGLNLTAEQQAQVKTLLLAENQEVESVHAEAARTGGDRVLKIIAARTNTYEKIRPLLTPEQLAKYDSLIKKMQSKKRGG
jgi:Spy/CpxP family protein refolding chaperone